jgi:hypothetical protein
MPFLRLAAHAVSPWIGARMGRRKAVWRASASPSPDFAQMSHLPTSDSRTFRSHAATPCVRVAVGERQVRAWRDHNGTMSRRVPHPLVAPSPGWHELVEVSFRLMTYPVPTGE